MVVELKFFKKDLIWMLDLHNSKAHEINHYTISR